MSIFLTEPTQKPNAEPTTEEISNSEGPNVAMIAGVVVAIVVIILIGKIIVFPFVPTTLLGKLQQQYKIEDKQNYIPRETTQTGKARTGHWDPCEYMNLADIDRRTNK